MPTLDERKGRAIKSDDGLVVGHAHPVPQTSLERTRWLVVLTKTGAQSWDSGGRYGARSAIKEFANEQGNAVIVEFNGREVSKVYPDTDRFSPVGGLHEEAGRAPNRKQLGLLMQNWHSGMGDPVYAVGSYYFADKPYPDPAIVEEALDWFETVTGRDARDTREIKSIVSGLRYFLKHDYAGAQEMSERGLPKSGDYRNYWYFVSPWNIFDPSQGYSATLFNRRGQSVNVINAEGQSEEDVRAAAKKHWPGAVEKRVKRKGGGMLEAGDRTVYITSSQNLAALIDNVYGHLSSSEAKALMRAIDDAERDGEDPRRAAIGYLRQLGITVVDTPSTRESRIAQEASRPVDDPLFIIQGLWSDGTVSESFGYDDEETAVYEAEKLARSSHFEGDRVRVISADGEQVWNSDDPEGTGAAWKRMYPEGGARRGSVREEAPRETLRFGLDPTSDHATIQRMIRFYVDRKGIGDYVDNSAIPMGNGVWRFRTRPFTGISTFRPRHGESRSGIEEHEVTHAELARAWKSKGVSESRSSSDTFTVEAGRIIYRNGRPFVHLRKEGDTRPTVADEVTHVFAEALNRLGVHRKQEGSGTYTVEPGRTIYRDGHPFVGVDREGDTTPVVADDVTHTLAYALNQAKPESSEYPGEALFKQARLASDDANRNPLAKGDRHKKAAAAWRKAADKLSREGKRPKAIEAESEAAKHEAFLKDNGMREARRRTPTRVPFVPDEDEALFDDPASIERFIERELAKHGDQVRPSFASAADDAERMAKKYDDDVRAQDRAYPGANAGKEAAAKAVLLRKSEALLRKASKGHGVGEVKKKAKKRKK